MKNTYTKEQISKAIEFVLQVASQESPHLTSDLQFQNQLRKEIMDQLDQDFELQDILGGK
ncbi:hypothetical protein HTVC034P_gp04 [Pelagibacter phage HTVC034P]|nr:hypothetical protein HTVC034P_gp04 [Pelagibacter phage HTVC034P]